MASNDNVAEDKTGKTSDEELLLTARARFQLADEAESEFRQNAKEDFDFRRGDQWPEEVRAARTADNRPCLTSNRIPQFVHQITNEQRQNRPATKVSPVDDAGDIDTAKILQGIIRHIEVSSNADVAIDTAFDAAVTCGRGWFRLITDYCDDTSFDQEIKFKRIRNPFSVYKDPHAQEPDGSDMQWCFIVEDVSLDEFKRNYPDSELSTLSDFSGLGNQAPDWINKESIRVAEYYYITYREVTLNEYKDGKAFIEGQEPPDLKGSEIVRSRPVQVPTVMWAKINGVEVLERTTIPCRWIPVIQVIGDEIDVDGKLDISGIVRNAKDSQRMLNYWASAETEAIALAPRAPFIIAEGQIEGYRQIWETANTKNHAVLPYKPTNNAGQPVAPPQRNAVEPAVQAITQARMMSVEDLKATTGIYDASLGNQSNEKSGIAIQRRNVQAQTSNFHFTDNLARSIRFAGRCAVDMIPSIYDTTRTIRIIGEDGETSIVQVNQALGKASGQDLMQQKSEYNLRAGKYDVVVEAGPSFATKRQEAVAGMMDFIKSYPPAAQVIGDLIARNMDIPAAKEIADRLKKTLPPGIADDPNSAQQPLPPEVQAKLGQMDKMIQQLTGALNQAHDELDKKTLELESKERIALAQIQGDLTKTLAQIDAKSAQLLFAKDMEAIKHRMDLLHANQPIESEAAGEPAAQPSPDQQPPTGGQPAPGQSME